jgi:hypothetical protein
MKEFPWNVRIRTYLESFHNNRSSRTIKRAVKMAAGIVAGIFIIKYIEILFLSNDRRHENEAPLCT